MLIYNLQILRSFLPVSTTFVYSEIQPFIRQAERDYIIPIIGKELYDDLITKITANSTDEDHLALLEKVRPPIASFAFMLWIPYGQTQIDSSGIRIVTSENLKTAFQWQIEDLKGSAMKSGFSAIEDLLYFLDSKADTYTLWTESDEYAEYKKHFIKSAKEFQKYFNIGSSRMTFMAMMPIMNRIEETLIKRILGATLYAEIKAELLSGDISDTNANLLAYIIPAVANITISRATVELAIKIDEFGISVQSSSQQVKGIKPAPDNMLSELRRQTQSDGDAFLKEIQDILNEATEEEESETLENDPDHGIGMF